MPSIVPVVFTFVILINLVISQALPPSNVELIYTTDETGEYGIAVNWTLPVNVCSGDYEYVGTSFFEQQTSKTYTRMNASIFFLSFSVADRCGNAAVIGTTSCYNKAKNDTILSAPVQSNSLFIVLPLGMPLNITSANGECTRFGDNTSCGIQFEFPLNNTACGSCAIVVPVYEYELNFTCLNFSTNNSGEGYCNTGPNATQDTAQYRLQCQWKVTPGNSITLQTKWSNVIIVDYGFANFTNATNPPPIPLPLLITIASVFVFSSIAAFIVVIIRQYCPERAGYLRLN